jgi:hypothetical protein
VDEKFKGKQITVTGFVDDISKDFTVDAKVILETGVLQSIATLVKTLKLLLC